MVVMVVVVVMAAEAAAVAFAVVNSVITVITGATLSVELVVVVDAFSRYPDKLTFQSNIPYGLPKITSFIKNCPFQGDTNFISVIHNIESILGITVQNALNTVDDEAAESNMDADDDEDDDSSSSDDDDDDDDDAAAAAGGHVDEEETKDPANFIVAAIADPGEIRE